MTHEEFGKRLEGLEQAIKPEVFQHAKVSTNDMIAQIKNRLIQRGERADGGRFTPYSTKTALIGSSSFTHKTHADKVFGSKEKRKKLQWRTVKGNRLALLPGGYKKIREIEGRQTDHKSFFRTGETLNSLKILPQGALEQAGDVVVIAGVDKGRRKIISGQSEREGIDILLPSGKEELKMTKTFIRLLFRTITDYLYLE